MNLITRIFIGLLACASCLPAFAAVTASVDRDHVALGETIQLLLQIDSSTNSQPDLNPLKRDFDILGTSRSSRMQFINGTSSSQTQLNLVLAPKHDGALQIPSVQWESQQSPALNVSVAANSGGNGSNGSNSGNGNNRQNGAEESADSSHVFMTSKVDQMRPFVQSAVVLTVRLYTDVPVSQATLEFPGNSDMIVKPFGKDTQSTESRNGHDYQVIERQYLLLPQKSGPVSLKGPLFDAQVQIASRDDPFGNDPFFGNIIRHMPLPNMMGASRPVHLYAKSIDLNVQPRPANAGANWLPAKEVVLEETWKPDSASHSTLHVGEPINRHLHITALGQTGAQLPDLSTLMPVPDGIKAYPDQAKIDDSLRGDSIVGTRDQDIALVASRPGHYDIPAIHLSWWDTTHNVQREAVVPQRSFDILAASGQAAVAPTPIDNSSAMPSSKIDIRTPSQTSKLNLSNVPLWQWVSLALGLLWLATIFAWWYSRRNKSAAMPKEQTAEKKTAQEKNKEEVKQKHAVVRTDRSFKDFQQACRNNDPRAARQRLLEWAATTWPQEPPHGLNALAILLGNVDTTELLRQLDRACFTGSEWQGESLAQSITPPNAQSRSEKPKPTIPDLYPKTL